MTLRIWITLIGLAYLLPITSFAEEPKVPTTVTELFADFDPRQDLLNTKVVREWEKDGIVYRYVTFHIGTFKGKPARMAAFYAFPKGAEKLPGLLHLHGGGQRAFLHEVEFYAKRGYACLSINWGGREMEEAKEGDSNTDWGAIDPTQQNDTYRTGEVIAHKNVGYAFTPHMNHRFTPDFAVARPLWMDQYLKGVFTFPKTPESMLVLTAEDGIPVLQVTPDASLPIERVQLLYSVDPDPQARFWRTAEATKHGNLWTAKLPILSLDQPVFAFANVYYKIPKSASAPQAEPTETLAISSMLHTATPDDLRRAGAKATDTRASLIDGFSHGWQDWYTLSANNPHHWEYSTRKLNDPKWRGQPDQKLSIEAQADHENELVIVLTENFFRSYRGQSQEFVAVVKLSGGKPETISLTPGDFTTTTGEKLSSWKNVDLLSLRAYFEKDRKLLGSKSWKGPQPEFKKLWWQVSSGGLNAATGGRKGAAG